MSDTTALLIFIVFSAVLAWVISWGIRLLVMGCERLLVRYRRGRLGDANVP